MAVTDVRNVLLSVIDAVYHYKAPDSISHKYCVWGETGARTAQSADNHKQYLTVTGEIYYYTDTEYDTAFDDICNALTNADISWEIIGISYDDQRKEIDYGIRWEITCGAGEIYR